MHPIRNLELQRNLALKRKSLDLVYNSGGDDAPLVPSTPTGRLWRPKAPIA
jgi:hypothetical protein